MSSDSKQIPALRGKIGEWTYYLATLTFNEVNQYVKKIDDELHTSDKLSELIQRSISSNYIEIKKYLLSQEERFFNALVLAVYDGSPNWIEVELNYGEEEYFNLGFLSLSGKEKIFPVDGQHRVEGIKAAIKEKPELGSDRVPVIFVGHSKTAEGMTKSRRLFTTLNRYAKKVTWDDIIALDEDDLAAIVTRTLLESYPLFQGNRIVISEQKAIPDGDIEAFTSIITLYQCNRELLKVFYQENKKKVKRGGIVNNFNDFLKYRPDDDIIEEFEKHCRLFWDSISQNLDVVDKFLNSPNLEFKSKIMRNKENGGNLVFRPIGLLPIVQAAITIMNSKSLDAKSSIKLLNKIDGTLTSKPWSGTMWNQKGNKMIMASSKFVRNMLIYLVDQTLLKKKQITALADDYAGKIDYSDDSMKLLEELRKIK